MGAASVAPMDVSVGRAAVCPEAGIGKQRVLLIMGSGAPSEF